MRIALIGQAAFAERALEVLHSRGEEIVRVFAPPDPPGGRPDPLKAKALALGVPFSQPATFKSDEAFEQFRALEAELLVMAFVTLMLAYSRGALVALVLGLALWFCLALTLVEPAS